MSVDTGFVGLELRLPLYMTVFGLLHAMYLL